LHPTDGMISDTFARSLALFKYRESTYQDGSQKTIFKPRFGELHIMDSLKQVAFGIHDADEEHPLKVLMVLSIN